MATSDVSCRTVLAVLVLALLGCSPQDAFDRAVRGSNHEEIGESRIASLREKLARQTAVKYKEPEAREYLEKLLNEMNHDFIVSEKSDGTWIKWFPESEQQGRDVSMKVVQHMFDLQSKRATRDE